MRFITTAAVAAIAAATAVSPAFAQTELAPFTGPRVDVTAGYTHLGGNDDTPDTDGFDYVASIGYDVQLGGAVVGIEGEAGGSTAKETFEDAGDRFRYSVGRDLYVGARAGFAVAPTTLAYIKGGYTNLRINTDVTLAGVSGTFEDHATLDGWRIGAGLEQKFNMFGPGGYVKAEYRYSNYGNVNDNGQNIDIDYDRHQILAGIGIRF